MRNILFFLLLIFSTNSVLSRHHKHESALRGNQDDRHKSTVCAHCCGDNTLAEKIYASLNELFKNKTSISGVVYFTSGNESSYSILEDKSELCSGLRNNLGFDNTTKDVINYSIINLLGNGSMFESSTKDNGTLGNLSMISSMFIDTEENFLAELDQFSRMYNFENIIQEGIDSENLVDSLIYRNDTIGSSDGIGADQELIDELIKGELNTTLEALEEISERIPGLRELTDIVKGDKVVSFGELFHVTNRLIRSLNTINTNVVDIDDNSFERLKESLSDDEIEKLKNQVANNSTIVKQPWYSSLKNLGAGIISEKNTIFSLIILIIESIVGFSPIGAIVTLVVRVIAAIVTVVHEIIQKRKNNSNLIRVLRSLDSIDAPEISKTSLANKLIDRISNNAESINESQLLLRGLYKDLSELAFNAEKNLRDFNENVIRDQLNKIISGKLASMTSNNSTDNLQSFTQNGLYYDNYGSRLLTSSSIIKTNFKRGFSVIADEIEEYLNDSYSLIWDTTEYSRDLNMNETIANSTDIVFESNSTDIIATNTTSITTQPTKVKWYDGLIQFSKKVTELSGVISMLDMLLELFTIVFGSSPQAESILAILRLIVYLIKSVFNIIGNATSNRKLVGVTRVIPEKIANDPKLLQLTVRKIKENLDAIQLEKDIINSQIEEIIKISEPKDLELIDQEFDKYLTYNATEDLLDEAKIRRDTSIETKIQILDHYLMHERLLSASESKVMAAELNFKSWMEKVGSFFDNSYEKIKQVIKSIFASIFKGNKIVAFIDKLIDLIISVIRSIYHAFKNKNTQRLLIQAIEECEESELQEALQNQLENTLKNENTRIIRLLY
ncbi:putative signal peptide-containing protein [Cryptosporidium canis]|uniref:Signal peptide-containing protein n=1 Tax=Cryptosporidium canis TaxID=195482 RepID=A0A9D5DH62_9CRYT|nr:putative signal peptide-containing protein [Cryptosporidium canis]